MSHTVFHAFVYTGTEATEAQRAKENAQYAMVRSDGQPPAFNVVHHIAAAQDARKFREEHPDYEHVGVLGDQKRDVLGYTNPRNSTRATPMTENQARLAASAWLAHFSLGN